MSDTPTICMLGYPPWPSGYDAMRLQVQVSAGSPYAGWPGCFINVRHYGGCLWCFWNYLWREGNFSRIQVSISSRYDLSCWNRCKNRFFPSFNLCVHLLFSSCAVHHRYSDHPAEWRPWEEVYLCGDGLLLSLVERAAWHGPAWYQETGQSR